MQNNLERVKPFYRIQVKVKTKYKTYWSNFCDITNTYINFQGIEIAEDTEVNSLKEGMELLETKDKVEIYYPWTSVVDIVLKRFLKE